jgi:phage terminase large subunit
VDGGAIDIDARLAAASDEEVLRIHAAVRVVRDQETYAQIARAFPKIDADSWPIDYEPVLAWRMWAVTKVAYLKLSPAAIKAWYSTRPHEFIEHWGTTYDPRNAGTKRPVKLPMLLFTRQRQFIDWLQLCVSNRSHGLVEKSRDMGLSWLACFVSVWIWATWMDGPSVGFGSRKEELVDKIGDPSSIFEKIRMAIRALPPFLLPEGLSEPDHLVFMKVINPQTGATLIGECGDNIGRGGRTLLYWKDEAAHYARPELIEAALADNTNVQIDISSVNGLGNVFQRRRASGLDWTPGDDMPRGRASVFVADWRHHPAKTQAWYDERKRKATEEGLLHIFAQEVDRNYSAAVEGTIIPAEWVQSAIGAHLKLGFGDDGAWSLALDVADGGGDTNALASIKGVVIKSVEAWGERDTGATTRRAVVACEGKGKVELQYDCIGVGAGVKAETNRLADEGLLSPKITVVPWNAGAEVRDKESPMIPDDRDSPLNKDFFYNWKAQAWWLARMRFEKTHRAVTEGVKYDPSELVSIEPDMPGLQELVKELSQPTAGRSTNTLKLIVNKTPEGTRSPNKADSVIMALNPAEPLKHVYPISAPYFSVDPVQVPPFWRRGVAVKLEGDETFALWAALDDNADVLYITTEHVGERAEASVNAQAIASRGKWIPGTIDSDETGLQARQQLAMSYAALGIPLVPADKAVEVGIADMLDRLSTGRLKVFSTCTQFFTAYRNYRRDGEGGIEPNGLMDCARLLCRRSSIVRMTKKPRADDFLVPAHGGDSVAGY